MTVQLHQDTAEARGEQRRYGRHRVMLSARLVTAQGIGSAVLLDLSCGGAMINAAAPLARGTHVVLIRGTFEAHGTVVWCEGRRIGIAFDETISEHRIEKVIAPRPVAAH